MLTQQLLWDVHCLAEGRSCFGKLVVLQASQGQVMVYPGACKFLVGHCAGKLAVGLCWKGEKYSGRGSVPWGWWHPSCLTHWNQRSCGISVDVAECSPLVHVGWMTTELLKLQLLEKHPGIVLLPPPSALLSNTLYPSLSNFFSLPQISTCFSAMLSKPLNRTSLACCSSLESLMKPQSLMFWSNMRYKFDAILKLFHLRKRETFKIQNILQIPTLLWFLLCLSALCLWCKLVAEVLSLNWRYSGELMMCEELFIPLLQILLSQTTLQTIVPEEGSFECRMSLHGSKQDIYL